MKNKCQDCGKCCLETEMMLSKRDINLILQSHSKNLQKDDFALKIDDYYQLKNINGHCVFFDISTKKCKIYANRPQGCRFYPLIYDKDKRICILDQECPRTHLFYQSSNEFEKTCKSIKKFVREQLNIDF